MAMIGTSLNQYQITASIGAGGMGEVFRARDTRLNRDVMGKIFPKVFSTGADELRHLDLRAKSMTVRKHLTAPSARDAHE